MDYLILEELPIMIFKLLVFVAAASLCNGYSPLIDAKEFSQADEEKRKQEGLEIEKLSQELAKFYDLPDETDILEITEKLLESPLVKEKNKKAIRDHHRRTFVFTYPSDGLKVKGFISFVPSDQENPLMLFLRGGNRMFGILNPGADFACTKNYTTISSTLRDGMSEGKDEFGGDDVNDIKNLIEYLPVLEEMLNFKISTSKRYMVGGSRGALEMFLTLHRFPELQDYFAKAVSLSGLVNLRICVEERPDMKQMFIEDFGLIENENEEDWINYRDPMLAIENIRKNLPILILHGAKDLRVSRLESYSIVEKLQENGNTVTYLEVEDGTHCLAERKDRMQIITDWLEKGD